MTQPTNGNFSITPPANGNLAEYGSKVNYTCNEGFSLVEGNSIRTCSEGCDHGTVGEWDGQKPICQRKKYAYIIVSSIIILIGVECHLIVQE